MNRAAVEAVLRNLGIEAKRASNKFVARCPNPAHRDGTPSWSMLDDGRQHCFGCDLSGGPWELVAAVRGCDLKDAGRLVAEWCGAAPERDPDVPVVKIKPVLLSDRVEYALPHGVTIPSLSGAPWFAPARQYLERRNVPEWQLARWHIGYATTGRCAFRVVVPVFTADRLVSYVARAFVDGVPRYDVARSSDPGARPRDALFGEPGFDYELDAVTIAEGVFGALALERCGAPNPCAILGATNLGIEKIETLCGFRTAYIATDPDRAGDDSYTAIAAAICRYTEPVRVVLTQSPDDGDDALRDALRRVIR